LGRGERSHGAADLPLTAIPFCLGRNEGCNRYIIKERSDQFHLIIEIRSASAKTPKSGRLWSFQLGKYSFEGLDARAQWTPIIPSDVGQLVGEGRGFGVGEFKVLHAPVGGDPERRCVVGRLRHRAVASPDFIPLADHRSSQPPSHADARRHAARGRHHWQNATVSGYACAIVTSHT